VPACRPSPPRPRSCPRRSGRLPASSRNPPESQKSRLPMPGALTPSSGHWRAEDRTGRRPDQQHRRANELAGAECDNRGGTCRGCRQGLRGGRFRGEEPGQPDRQGHRRYQRSGRATARLPPGSGRRDRRKTFIGEVGRIATAIATAVEEQGAATAVIAKTTQQTAASTQDLSPSVASRHAGRDRHRGSRRTKYSAPLGNCPSRPSQVGTFILDVRAA
jgi:hypothetical protein